MWIEEMPDPDAKDEQAEKWKCKHLQLNEATSGPAINMMEQFQNEVTAKKNNTKSHGKGKPEMHRSPSSSEIFIAVTSKHSHVLQGAANEVRPSVTTS
jgi:hypothetical protein